MNLEQSCSAALVYTSYKCHARTELTALICIISFNVINLASQNVARYLFRHSVDIFIPLLFVLTSNVLN